VVVACVGAAVALGGATAGLAQELVNRDEVAHTVTVMIDSERQQVSLAPAGKLEGFCPDGCVIRIDEDEKRDFIIEGSERLSIEGGLVYFDGEIAAKPEDGAAAPGEPAEKRETQTE
jgi:hypothetical protein